jgi:hypothetical protein
MGMLLCVTATGVVRVCGSACMPSFVDSGWHARVGGDGHARATLLCVTATGVVRVWARLQGGGGAAAHGGRNGLPALLPTGGFCQVLVR